MSGWKVCIILLLYILVLLFTNMLGMHKSNEGLGCNSLLEKTAVLGEETSQMLFVSAQETNIALLCIKYAA